MTDSKAIAINTARVRVRAAQEKSDRQQRRYAMRATTGQTTAKSDEAKADKALMAELEAELEASRNALRALEAA